MFYLENILVHFKEEAGFKVLHMYRIMPFNAWRGEKICLHIHQNVHSSYHRRVTLQMIFIFFLNTYSIISKTFNTSDYFYFLTS